MTNHIPKLVLHTAANANCCERIEWGLRYKNIPHTAIDVEKAGLFGHHAPQTTQTVEQTEQIKQQAQMQPQAQTITHSAPQTHTPQQLSAFGRIPVLFVDDQPLTESMAIAEYLEEIAPTPALTYTNPWLQAKVREVCEIVNSSIHPAQNTSIIRYYRADLDKAAMKPLRARWIAQNLRKTAPLLWKNSHFAVGTQVTWADLFIAVIHQKSLELGATDADYGDTAPLFRAYRQFLREQPQIHQSSPWA